MSRSLGAVEPEGRLLKPPDGLLTKSLLRPVPLLGGQTSEGIPVVIVKGLKYERMDGEISYAAEALLDGFRSTVLATLRMRPGWLLPWLF